MLRLTFYSISSYMTIAASIGSSEIETDEEFQNFLGKLRGAFKVPSQEDILAELENTFGIDPDTHLKGDQSYEDYEHLDLADEMLRDYEVEKEMELKLELNLASTETPVFSIIVNSTTPFSIDNTTEVGLSTTPSTSTAALEPTNAMKSTTDSKLSTAPLLTTSDVTTPATFSSTVQASKSTVYTEIKTTTAPTTERIHVEEIENLIISVSAVENNLEDKDLVNIYEIFKSLRDDNPYFEKLIQDEILSASSFTPLTIFSMIPFVFYLL